MAEIANFAILSRPANSSQLREHPPNSPEYTYIASAINIALSILEHPTGRQRLTELALEFDSSLRGQEHFSNNINIAREWIQTFLSKTRSHFPAVVIDGHMSNADLLGTHPRGEWDGQLRDFDPRDQMVMINASRVSDMMAAAVGPQPSHRQRFRDFQFLFATTFVHEVGGHLLVTFLGNGRPITPPQMTAPNYGTDIDGEAGRYLELHFFGGTTEYYEDARQDSGQTGIPHQIDGQGRAWKTRQSVVNSICLYNFSFPFAREGPAVDPYSMRTMGRMAEDPPQDPRDRAMMARQLPLVGTLRNLPGYNVATRDMLAIPSHPERRLIAVN